MDQGIVEGLRHRLELAGVSVIAGRSGLGLLPTYNVG